MATHFVQIDRDPLYFGSVCSGEIGITKFGLGLTIHKINFYVTIKRKA